MELAKYKACICEGSAEEAIMDILIDNHLLIFEREEMLIILNEKRYDDFKRSKLKPSDYCKSDFRMKAVKSYGFVKDYFSNPIILTDSIKKYHEMSRIPKGEYTLLNLMKN